jgi:hypothetical protein
MNQQMLSCGHACDSTRCIAAIVDRLSDSSVSKQCENCFQVLKPQLLQDRLNAIPIDTSLECMLCFGARNAPTRLDPNIQMGLCDACRMDSERMEREAVQAGNLLSRYVDPDRITENLFIGPKESAYDLEKLQLLGIQRVLVCCSHLNEYFKDDVTYLRLPMADSLDQNLLLYLPLAFEFIQDGINRGEKILIHCNAGVSRSGAVLVCWIMKSMNVSFPEALAFVKAKRPIVTPNSNFVDQIINHTF